MNNVSPFNEDWFKSLYIMDKVAWLIEDTKKRPALEFKMVESPIQPVVVAIPEPPKLAFDRAQDPPTPVLLNPAAKMWLPSLLKQHAELEITLPIYRAFQVGAVTRHSLFSIVCVAHALCNGYVLEETDRIMLDAADNKYQFHYSNLGAALLWAFGSDNPVLPDGLGLPTNSLRDLICMTKKVHKRSKLKFIEFADLMERL